MARRPSKRAKPAARRSQDWLFPVSTKSSDIEIESSLLDVVDNVLNKGMVLNGDVILGVANVDLIYVKLSVLLAAMDKVAGETLFTSIAAPPSRKKRKKRTA
jgi:hypothetical protein